VTRAALGLFGVASEGVVRNTGALGARANNATTFFRFATTSAFSSRERFLTGNTDETDKCAFLCTSGYVRHATPVGAIYPAQGTATKK
jgi:hypothetical protein